MRKPLSKRVRFEVFKRDSFTCQYCGKQPPEVILHVDHIAPVAEGGSDDFDNLITSCQDCNLGKAAVPLGTVAPRPDASLMLAEAAQEMAEVIAYRETLAKKREEEQRLVADFQQLFFDISDADWCPGDAILIEAIDKCRGDYSCVEEAVRATAIKHSSGGLNFNYWPKFFWGCFWNAMRDAS